MSKDNEATGTRSVERALSLLTAFTEESPELRVSELVAASGLGQSTVSRLVGALTALDYLAQDERTGHYRLGPQVVRLASIALNRSEVHQQARQPAQNLAHTLGLGVNVGERHGDKLTYLLNFEGAHAPRSTTLVGRFAPLHATALGKALLSDLDADEVAGLLGRDFPRFTARTLTTLDTLVAELEAVRLRGYAVELEEAALGRACIAAPIRNRHGRVTAALSVSGPLSVMDLPAREVELSRAAIELAEQVSSGIGYLGGVAV